MDNERGSHYWIWIVLGLTIFTITVSAGILLYIEWTWEPPEEDYDSDILNVEVRALSETDRIEVTVHEESILWSHYLVIADEKNLTTMSDLSKEGDIVIFSGITFGKGIQLEIKFVDLTQNKVICIDTITTV